MGFRWVPVWSPQRGRGLLLGLGRQLGAKSGHGGVVADVQPGSPADNASVQKGDMILEVNRQPVKGVADMKRT